MSHTRNGVTAPPSHCSLTFRDPNGDPGLDTIVGRRVDRQVGLVDVDVEVVLLDIGNEKDG